MEKEQILPIINQIFIHELDNPAIVLQETTTAEDIREWDSLTHIQLVYAIEKKFRIRFSTAEITRWKNIGELCNSVAQRLKTT
jgi:acyl carrier protein